MYGVVYTMCSKGGDSFMLSCKIYTLLVIIYLHLLLQGFNMVANAVDVMTALITWFRLICSGDIELNPGPLSEEDLLAFTSLLSQSLTLADIVMNGLAGAHTEDSIRDKGWNNEKVHVNILQQLNVDMEIPIIIPDMEKKYTLAP